MEWIYPEDRLPEIIEIDGVCNMVLVYHKRAPECSGPYQVSNTKYLNLYPEQFDAWMPLPAQPEKD